MVGGVLFIPVGAGFGIVECPERDGRLLCGKGGRWGTMATGLQLAACRVKYQLQQKNVKPSSEYENN